MNLNIDSQLLFLKNLECLDRVGMHTGLDSVIQSVIQLWEGGVYIYNRTYW